MMMSISSCLTLAIYIPPTHAYPTVKKTSECKKYRFNIPSLTGGRTTTSVPRLSQQTSFASQPHLRLHWIQADAYPAFLSRRRVCPGELMPPRLKNVVMGCGTGRCGCGVGRLSEPCRLVSSRQQVNECRVG
ncbi:hypothetical protein DM02DRAFT_145445 [Periconia macrospinosa]|uniref:Secreted protein n=1 Tax=Periconia macrospinosa TaxID=97972 RepID=A0A2V1E2U0_9PLEO|nr:hypothetical protein DM02DRAFT_145445 [Periconia macrospinosa]